MMGVELSFIAQSDLIVFESYSVAGPGFEPRTKASKASVMPFHHPAVR